MKEKLINLKNWTKEHKGILLVEAGCVALYFGGFIVGTKINDLRLNAGLEMLRADGALKYFDPATGTEIVRAKDIGEFLKNYNK